MGRPMKGPRAGTLLSFEPRSLAAISFPDWQSELCPAAPYPSRPMLANWSLLRWVLAAGLFVYSPAMNIVEKAPLAPQTAAAAYDRFRLRSFVENLGPDEVQQHGAPIQLADIAPILEGNPRAVMFG